MDRRAVIFEQLTAEDRAEFEAMRKQLEEPIHKNRRNKSTELFGDVIDRVKRYVMRGDADEWKRAFVCGICWIQDTIAINTRHLRLLVVKCKSSINNYFKNMNYGTVPATSDAGTALARYFPFLKDNYQEMRQWSVRKKMSLTPQPADYRPMFPAASEIPPQMYITPPPSEVFQNSGLQLTIGSTGIERNPGYFEQGIDNDEFSFSRLPEDNQWPDFGEYF